MALGRGKGGIAKERRPTVCGLKNTVFWSKRPPPCFLTRCSGAGSFRRVLKHGVFESGASVRFKNTVFWSSAARTNTFQATFLQGVAQPGARPSVLECGGLHRFLEAGSAVQASLAEGNLPCGRTKSARGWRSPKPGGGCGRRHGIQILNSRMGMNSPAIGEPGVGRAVHEGRSRGDEAPIFLRVKYSAGKQLESPYVDFYGCGWQLACGWLA